MTKHQHMESDVDAELEAEVAATLAAIHALTEMQERMRTHFKREREKLAHARSARAPRTPEERAACLRTLSRTLKRVPGLASVSGLLVGLLYFAPALARWIDGVIAR